MTVKRQDTLEMGMQWDKKWLEITFYSGKISFVNSSQIYSNFDDLNQGQDEQLVTEKGQDTLHMGLGKQRDTKWPEV